MSGNPDRRKAQPAPLTTPPETDETNAKNERSKAGAKTSMFGYCWVENGCENAAHFLQVIYLRPLAFHDLYLGFHSAKGDEVPLALIAPDTIF